MKFSFLLVYVYIIGGANTYKLINEVNKLDLIDGHIAWLFPLLPESENTIRNVETFIFFLISKVYLKNFTQTQLLTLVHEIGNCNITHGTGFFYFYATCSDIRLMSFLTKCVLSRISYFVSNLTTTINWCRVFAHI